MSQTHRDLANMKLKRSGNTSESDSTRDRAALVGQGYALLAIADAIEASVDKLVASRHADPSHPGAVTGAEVDDALSTLASLSGRGATDVLRDARAAYVVAANNATDLPTFRRVHDASDILRRAGYLR